MTTTLQRLSRAIRGVLAQHITVKVVPESAREAISFRINVTVLLFGVVLLGTIIGGGIHLFRATRTAPEAISRQQAELQNLQANLDEALYELQELLRSTRPLDEELENTVGSFAEHAPHLAAPAALSRLQLSDYFQDMTRSGDVTRFPNAPAPTVSELDELRSFVGTMESSLGTLTQTRALLESTDRHLRDVPHFWPVANGAGAVTMEYGPNVHPFTGQWYLHKGFDIAGPVGLTVVSAADGMVVESAFDPGYGNNLIIRHRWGFFTRYAHLHQVFVREGQEISQGQRIGTLGSSGFSSGPHLHFEVIIGDEVLDPAPFLMISNTFQRGGHAASRRR
jgi:murein DD-endopeptidase MepM/ murein hydrolase activator NlpD